MKNETTRPGAGPASRDLAPPPPSTSTPMRFHVNWSGDGPGAIADPQPAMLVNLAVKLPSPLRVIASWVLFYVLFVIVILLAFPLVRRTNSLAGGLFLSLGLMVLTGMLMGLIPGLQRWRARRKVKRMFPAALELPPEALLRRVQKTRPWLSGKSAFAELMRQLGAHGHRRQVFRVGLGRSLSPVEPIEVDFEPRHLDETDCGFVELEEALACAAADTTPDREQDTRPPRRPPELLHRVWRNVTLKEGRLSLLIFVALFAWVAYGAYQMGRFTPGLLLGTIFLLMRLFSPATGGAWAAKWLVLPQGVILRIPRKETTTDYHLDRMNAVLGLYQLGKAKWQVYAADPMFAFETVATPREVAFLLRAWQSPVTPALRRGSPSAGAVRNEAPVEGLQEPDEPRLHSRMESR
ncbi:MAG: hypothetical protein IT449_05855 [Phycisphaerales bacterium]|nr:hypothetical protein [Phycisphaerales bacterium]